MLCFASHTPPSCTTHAQNTLHTDCYTLIYIYIFKNFTVAAAMAGRITRKAVTDVGQPNAIANQLVDSIGHAH